MAGLDTSKAFDRVNHVKLFNVMRDAGIPVRFIKLLMNWYSKMMVLLFTYIMYLLNGTTVTGSLKSGVRQGGMLSPELFDIYIGCVCDKLLDTL